jgi:hypothetical protein
MFSIGSRALALEQVAHHGMKAANEYFDSYRVAHQVKISQPATRMPLPLSRLGAMSASPSISSLAASPRKQGTSRNWFGKARPPWAAERPTAVMREVKGKRGIGF